jgi:hypothetical protein
LVVSYTPLMPPDMTGTLPTHSITRCSPGTVVREPPGGRDRGLRPDSRLSGRQLTNVLCYSLQVMQHMSQQGLGGEERT